MDEFDGFLEEPLSLHKYLYANADPVNFRDPSGFISLSEYAANVRNFVIRQIQPINKLALRIACVITKAATIVGQNANIATRVALESGILELIFCRCRPTTQKAGTGKGGPLGGAYSDLRANGGERHHMPSQKALGARKPPLPAAEGPAIRMERQDHYGTASHPRQREGATAAAAYRQQQIDLIGQGRFNDAVLMDIKDVRSKFGRRYDEGITQMLDYLDYAEKFADLIYAASGRCAK